MNNTEIKNFIENKLVFDVKVDKVTIETNSLTIEESNLLFNFNILDDSKNETSLSRFVKGLQAIFSFVRQRDGVQYRFSMDHQGKKRVSMIDRLARLDAQKIIEKMGELA